MERELALVVLGANGYTGKLVCEYLSKQKVNFPWAIAGRSEEKLNILKKELGVDVAVRTVDFKDAESLDKLCSSTRLLLTCAGPFSEIGMPVVEACVRCRTHYVDSTGEFNFVRQVIDRFHDEAKEKSILIVPCCAFDSIPADLGNYVMRQIPEVKEVKAYYRLSGKNVSGGTARSIVALSNNAEEADYDPYSLVPKDTPRPPHTPTRRGIWYEMSEKKLSSPFIMSVINERVVRRTNALLGYDGTYVEALEGSFWDVFGSAISTYVMGGLLSVPFLRRYVSERLLPPPGTGPSQTQKDLSWYKCFFVGLDESGCRRREVYLSDTRDMYTASAMYLGESAMSLLQLENEGNLKSGVLTPAVAFGEVLRARVEKAGVVLGVVDELN